MITETRSWSDENAILNLAKNDQPALEKKVKKFLKNLFKCEVSNEDESKDDGKIDHAAVLAKLNDFYECIDKIGKKKHCRHFIGFTLDLFVGHSKIRESFLENRDKNKALRRKLIDLFCLLCSSQLEVCKDRDNLVDLVLGSYDATLSIEDQSLLRLLSQLELSGISLQRYQPFVWGVNGAVFYASKHSQKLAFLKMPSIEEVFNGFEGKCLQNSLTSFPIDLKMSDSPVEIVQPPDFVCYDPRFLLPMFFHFLSGQSIVKCHKFISYGALSFTIAALSSHCPRIREVAYQVLFRLHHHMECASYPQDRKLWTGLIDYIRSGLTEANQRIESVHTVFFVRMIDILLKPLNPLYSSIRQYLLSRQLKPYNFQSLPMFYRICMHLISTTNMQTYGAYQKFAINWITDSLRTASDVRLCHRKQVFSDMLVLYNSPLCVADNKPLIMKLIITLAGQFEGAKVLCFDCAIFAWIKHLLINVPSIDISEVTNKNLLYKLVVTIWETVFAQFSARKEAMMEADPTLELPPFIFYKAFGFEIIDLLSRIVYKSPDKSRIDKFVQISEQILAHTGGHELVAFNIKKNLCSNLPVNLESMLAPTETTTQ